MTYYYDYDNGFWRMMGLTDSCDAPLSVLVKTRRTTVTKEGSTGCNKAGVTLIHDPDKVGDFRKVKGIYSLEDRSDPSNSPYYPRIEHTFTGRRIR